MAVRLFNLLKPDRNILYGSAQDSLEEAVASGNLSAVNAVDGQFVAVAQRGNVVRCARTLGAVGRYMVLEKGGDAWVVLSDRIDHIRGFCQEHDLLGQFNPYYTRMVPAHYLVDLRFDNAGVIPRVSYSRFFTPGADALPPDIMAVGQAYIGALHEEVRRFLQWLPTDVPLGVLLSGGVDSSSVLATFLHVLDQMNQPRQRIRTFTLVVDGGGTDLAHAAQVVEALGVKDSWLPVPIGKREISIEAAIGTMEDYHVLDIQGVAVLMPLVAGIRSRLRDELRWLVDGDGGDENLRSYPIQDSHLDLDPVLDIPLLYHEGWGIDAVRHNSTFTSGLSRAYVRTYAPLDRYGFRGASPYTSRRLVEVSSRIPFRTLTTGSEERLYHLKGDVVHAGVKAVLGMEFPIFPKARFQQGCMPTSVFDRRLRGTKTRFRRVFEASYG
ncbi:asparagine synthetase B family protein [Candidatus Berkelbacteria bacterium]|nr:asparagine synthetase B family protein [Candidatus Berkelbacteria bacterium]